MRDRGLFFSLWFSVPSPFGSSGPLLPLSSSLFSLFLFVFCISVTCILPFLTMAASRFAVRSVAIIGAGSSGLAAARYIQAQGAYDRIVVYEKRSEVGGVWNYSARPTDQEHIPQTSPYLAPDAPLQPLPGKGHHPESAAPVFPTPTYDELYVNIPHPLMGFTDLSMAAVHKAAHPGEPLLIYPHRQTIEDYLVAYSQEVRHLIRFCTKVDDVRLLRQRPRQGQANGTSNELSDDGSSRGDEDDYVDSWEVRATDTRDASPSAETFDAVIVAHGHYDTTFVPAIANIEAFHEAHPGVLTHSKRYRSPEPFRSKRVVAIGNAASGLDIAGQINAVAQRPVYLSVRSPTSPESLKRLVGAEEVPEIQEFLVAERGVRLADGRVLRDLDAVVFCTGYLFSLPFLEKAKPPPQAATDDSSGPDNLCSPDNPDNPDSPGSSLGSLLSTGRRVHRLYDDLFHIDHPTLAFLGLPIKVVPYPLAQAQAAIVSRVWANTLDLPSKQAMDEWERETEAVRGPSFHVWQPGGDSAYINATYKRIMEARQESPASRAGKEPPRWDDRLLWMRTVTLQGKMKFEDTGRTATSMEELGFNFEESGGAAAADGDRERVAGEL